MTQLQLKKPRTDRIVQSVLNLADGAAYSEVLTSSIRNTQAQFFNTLNLHTQVFMACIYKVWLHLVALGSPEISAWRRVLH